MARSLRGVGADVLKGQRRLGIGDVRVVAEILWVHVEVIAAYHPALAQRADPARAGGYLPAIPALLGIDYPFDMGVLTRSAAMTRCPG